MMYASVMQLHAGQEAEYQARHDALWPELAEHLKDCGIRNYRIFLHPDTLQLFAHFETDQPLNQDKLRQHPVMQRWWDHMADIMDTTADSSEPVAIPLHEVFYLP